MGTGFPAPVFLGIVLIVGGVFLFFLGRLRPALRRDSDIVYALIALISGLILIIDFNLLNFGLIFQQVLLIGALIALTWENLVLRAKSPLARSREIPPRQPREPHREPATYRREAYTEPVRSRQRRRDVVIDSVDEWEAELPQSPRASIQEETASRYRPSESSAEETAMVTRSRRPRPQYPPRRARPDASDREWDNTGNFDDDDL
ncbi:MAG: Ycf66 family protein [Gloeomargarita sp. SKYBB_i_bin120]|nr:Ycf66 family protein [Gloeomargarita sp. SKYG98]MCS7292970.1 Ycf66 family protein [Gloeomargarita sp. SKYB120]MDW8178535.1 Ycf66 family protein [Gloeomargarita sp. SKYBB_i_bin120]